MKTSKDPRHQSRRLALAEIYSEEMNNSIEYANETKVTSLETLEITSYDKKLFKQIVEGIRSDKDDLKEAIQQNAKDWALDKIFKIDLAILMVSVWELKNTSTPHKVIVDEAVELAKEFGEIDSPKFVNGVLSGVIVSLKIETIK